MCNPDERQQGQSAKPLLVRVLWHMHSLGVLLFISLLFLEPAPHMYTYAFLLYAVGCFMSLFWFCLICLCMSLPLEPLHEP